MTIKQQGGIFGRNPDFNDVTANNVTSNDLTADEFLSPAITSRGPIYNPSTDGGQSSTFKVIGGLSSSSSSGQRFGGISFGSTDRVSSSAIAAVRTGSNDDHMGLGFFVHSPNIQNDPAELAVTIDSNKNIVFANSGSGIDFSATSGTGTSELFDDYEEGEFTPSFIASGVTITHDIQVGRYVKVGGMVTVWINIGTDAVSGTAANLSITGLPYSSESGYSASGYVGLNYSFASPVGAISMASSTTELRFYSNNSSTRQTSAILGTGTNSNRLHIVCSYRVA